MRVTWVQPADLLRHELAQSAAEGRDVSKVLARWALAGGTVEPPRGGVSEVPAGIELRRLAAELLDELDRIPEVGAAVEPSDWPAIRATVHPVRLEPAENMQDRVRGAWLGRAAGCLLGKPVEKTPREGIEQILRATGRWPLTRYFTSVDLPPDVAARWPWNRQSRATSLEETIAGMPEDDDLNYTMMALRLLETHGPSFTPDDVAQSWLLDLPAGRVFTAERAAYRNLLEGLTPPCTARVRNPFREWIGALIRADLYGWVTPGDLTLASELAWRDASVSHTRNGIYAALFAAGLASAAMCVTTPQAALDAAFTVVPPQSRLARAVRFGRNLATREPDPVHAYPLLEAEFPNMHWVHALNNSALIAYALQAGNGDFGRSIGLAVMAGLDTDSAAATVGGVVGALGGATGIPATWTEPLHNRIASSIPGCDGLSFTELAARTLAVTEATR